jgi:DNA-binding transcriptional LysR family regulator
MENSLLYIYTVYKAQSFSRAAESLYMTQPALSIAIKKIEQSIGAPLFDRKKNPLQLTDIGQIYIDQIEKIMAVEEDVKRRIDDLHTLQSGHLTIAGTHFVNAFILPPVIKDFSAAYPNVKINLMEHNPEENLALIKDGQADLSFNAGHFSDDVYHHTIAFHDYIFLAVPAHFALSPEVAPFAMTYDTIVAANHPYETLPATAITHFRHLPVILLTPNNSHYHTTKAIYAEASLSPNVMLSVDQSATAYHLAASGIAAVFVSDLIIKNNKAFPLYYFKLKTPIANRTFYGLTNPFRYETKATAVFMQMLRAHYHVETEK